MKVLHDAASAKVLKDVWNDTRGALRVLPENETLFGEVLMAQRRTSISINSAYGISKLRQNVVTTGTGSASDATKGKIVLSTGATAGSSTQIDSAEVGIYAPGFAAEVGIGIRPQHTLAGTAFARWGAISVDDENGFYFKLTAGGAIAAVRRKEDVEEDVVDRESWNIDPLDGSGRSGINITATKGYIWQVDFSWYGYGLIVYGIVRQMEDFLEVQHFIPGHVIQVDDDISISEPNLQIFAEISNGDQATDYALDIGGMQYSTVGINEGARQRNVNGYVTNVDVDNTTDTHLLSFRRKSGFLNRSFVLQSLDTKASGETIIFEVWLGGTVTGALYENPQRQDPNEVSIEIAREATSFDPTGAVLLDTFFTDAGQGNQVGSPETGIIDLNLPANGIVTVTGRTEDGPNATVTRCQVKGREGW